MCERAGAACIPRRREQPVSRHTERNVRGRFASRQDFPSGMNGQPIRSDQHEQSDIRSNGVVQSSAAGTPDTGPMTEINKLNDESLLASTTSSVRFARRLLNGDRKTSTDLAQSLTEAPRENLHVLEGSHDCGNDTPWQFLSIDRPPAELMDVLIDTYICRAHWFILIFHAPSLKAKFHGLWHQTTWKRDDAGHVLMILLVAVLGAICATKDPAHPQQQLLDQFDVDKFTRDSAAEVKIHLLEVMSDCSVESVQIAQLLARYYTATGRPGMGWTVVGMAARNAYAGGLYHPRGGSETLLAYEVRCRTWQSIKMTDTFTAFFHGRPPSLDCNFSNMIDFGNSSDLDLPPSLVDDPLLNHSGVRVDLGTYHKLKFEMYDIMARALAAFRQIRQSREPQHQLILTTIRDAEDSLYGWRSRIPRFFDYSVWDERDILGVDSRYEDSASCRDAARMLELQRISLQATLDNNVIMLYRPILELGHSAEPQHTSHFSAEVILHAIGTAIDAATRTSSIPLQLFEKEMPLSYILMNSLTAAVILCLGPIALPGSTQATKAKSGLVRIIDECEAMKGKSALADHMSKLLPTLLSRAVEHETEQTGAHAVSRRHSLNNSSHSNCGSISTPSTNQPEPSGADVMLRSSSMHCETSWSRQYGPIDNRLYTTAASDPGTVREVLNHLPRDELSAWSTYQL